jgi:hypothetical protein
MMYACFISNLQFVQLGIYSKIRKRNNKIYKIRVGILCVGKKKRTGTEGEYR